jgi:hypothetical protein
MNPMAPEGAAMAGIAVRTETGAEAEAAGR